MPSTFRAPSAQRLRLLDSRFGVALLLGFMFLGIQSALRVALVARAWPELDGPVARLPRVFLVGLLHDLGVLGWILAPALLALALMPLGCLRSRAWRALMILGLALTLALLAFAVAAEWFFWDEFQARFNFIAVDYLVYTTEVLANLRESYPLPLVVGGCVGCALVVLVILRAPLARALAVELRTRRLAPELLLLLVPPFTLLVDQGGQATDGERLTRELSANGLASLVRAFRDPVLDYSSLYRTLPEAQVFAALRTELGCADTELVPTPASDITRSVTRVRPLARKNVIFVVVESLSASFLGAFGNTRGLTPHLDALADESLFFTQLFATGTRTVRGLEALTLSVPPTPGHAIPRRLDNQNLSSIGWVFREAGYDVKYVYGGRAYFDNMRSFFGGNGFDIVDRDSLSDEEIRFSNAWGVCDQDLLARVLREADDSFAARRPFFTMAMTTSNHRPYTYPDVISIPPGTSRDGAVAYTDLALGEFLELARSRPWFSETLFVICADHCASSAGKNEVELARHHIPCWIYAPGFVLPERLDRIASQIDIAPTLLSLLGFEYQSRFFGQDQSQPAPARAFVGNYQSVGLFAEDRLTLLCPKRESLSFAVGQDFAMTPCPEDARALARTIAYYQGASMLYASGGLRHLPVVASTPGSVSSLRQP